MCTIYDVLSYFMLFCCKIVIYAVLSRYLFCHNLRAFAWRKIQPRIAPVEKKLLISGTLSFVIIVSHADIMDCENHAIKGKFADVAKNSFVFSSVCDCVVTDDDAGDIHDGAGDAYGDDDDTCIRTIRLDGTRQ